MFNKNKLGKPIFMLMLIVAIGALVRLWGIGFGLPHTQCRPDEDSVVLIVASPLRYFHPRDFIYPSLYKYIVLFFYALYFIGGIIFGRFHSINDFIKEFAVNPANFYLINRIISALFGAATIVVIYKIARKLFNEKIAVISSFFLSLAYLHVKSSHFGVADIALTFFIACSLFFILESYENKLLKNYFASGICAGLATSTKYPAALLIFTIFIAHFLNCTEVKAKKINYLFDRRMAIFLIVFLLSFLAGTPFALIDAGNFIREFFSAVKVTSVNSGIYVNPPMQAWWYHLNFSLLFGLGFPLLFASLAGIIVFFNIDWRRALILCSFPFVYYSVFANGFVPMTRYMVPLVPFLCLTAALFTFMCVDKILKYFNNKYSTVIISITVLTVIMPSAYNVVLFDKLLSKKDNRVIAGEWIAKNIPSGSSICQIIDNQYAKLQLFPSAQYLVKKYGLVSRDMRKSGKGKFTLMEIKYKLDYLTDSNIPNYNEWDYHADSNAFLFVDTNTDSLPDYIILNEDFQSGQGLFSDKLRKILLHFYHLKKAFPAKRIQGKANIYDRFDAFFVPFSGFEGIERPGPSLWIYEKS